MFKLFKKPPEIPEDMDYLADSPANALDSQIESSEEKSKEKVMVSGIAAKRAGKEASNHSWLPMLLGALLFIFVAFGAYWALKMYYAPVPAEIPEGDILATLTSNPTAVPPGNSPLAPQAPAPDSSLKPNPSQSQTLSTPSNLPAPPAGKPPAAGSTNAKPQSPSESATAPKPDPRAEAQSEVSQEVLSGIFSGNPFVDLSSLRSIVTASSSSGSMQLPHFGGSGNMALPEVPRPAVSPDLLPSPGEIRTPAGPAGASSAPPTMGGIIKSADGSAIAIMGDGAVLSEGDTYKGDRRVTFIGGEGIQFDDGNSIAFGGQNK